MTESAKLRDLRRAVKEGQEVIAVHYACESLAEAKDHPPAVSCIAVANLKNGTRQAFSLAYMPSEIEVTEREIGLLDRFYAHLAEHERSVVLHWNMNSSLYGFEALRNRYRYLTSKDPGQRPSEHLLYDLDDIIGDEYGENYVRHEKFYNLATLNEIGLFSFLPGKEGPPAVLVGGLRRSCPV